MKKLLVAALFAGALAAPVVHPAAAAATNPNANCLGQGQSQLASSPGGGQSVGSGTSYNAQTYQGVGYISYWTSTDCGSR